MSRRQKTICDNCNKEIDYENWYYVANITSQSNHCCNGEKIMQGDYCKECFKELISKRLGIKEKS